MNRELTIKSLFTLTRLGIGNHSDGFIGEQNDWPAVQTLAREQGLAAIALDGIECLPDDKRPPKEITLQWIGEVTQSYEYRYELYQHAIADLASFYSRHGMKMMLLKGYACGINWPKPNHRPCGDIDIWLFGKQVEADIAVKEEQGLKIITDEPHHTVFYCDGFMVENHYDFINVHHHKSNVAFETILKELGQEDGHYIEVCGERVYVPSPNFHALFLLRHTMSHFASTNVVLRQLLDWGFFVKEHSMDIDWKWLLEILEEFKMKELFDIFNAICVEDLGFSSSSFPYIQFNPVIKERVLNEILTPRGNSRTPNFLLKRVVFKYKRWKANEWKHKLCYKDSMWSAFWSRIKSHLLKPSSI